MPFEKIRSKRRSTAEVSVSKNAKSHAAVNLTKEVIEKVGWTDNSKLEFLWGTGDQLGLLKIVQMAGGVGFDNLQGRTSRCVSTGRTPRAMVKEKMWAVEVEYKVEGKSLIITLPEYFYKAQPEEI